MTSSLGEPEHYAACKLCERIVGGPYYERPAARERLREHVLGVHSSDAGWMEWAEYGKRAPRSVQTMRPAIRALYQEGE